MPANLLKIASVNTFSQIWIAGMSVIFIPIYLKYLGAEQFAIIGIFILLRTLISLLNGGAVPILGQQFARYRSEESRSRYLAVMLNTSTIIFTIVAICICISIYQSSKFLVEAWLNVPESNFNSTVNAIKIASLALVPQFIEAPLRGISIGLNLQTRLAILLAFMATFRGIGAVMLAWETGSISSFFWWQVLVGSITCAVLYFMNWKKLGRPQGINFEPRKLFALRYFAAGMVSLTTLSLLLSQLDKFLAPKILTLSELAYYNISATICAMLFTVAASISQAFYPRLCEQQYKKESCRYTYELNIKAILICLAPLVGFLWVGGEAILLLWLGDSEAALLTSEYLTPMLLATLFMSFNLPLHNLQLAVSQTSEILKTHFIILSIFIILLIVNWNKLDGVNLAGVLALSMGIYTFISCLLVKRFCINGISRKRLILNNFQALFYLIAFPALSTIFFLGEYSIIEKIAISMFTSFGTILLILVFHLKQMIKYF